jgi:Isocitrate dehydrogenases
LGAIVGGIGIAPGGNINDNAGLVISEVTLGTAADMPGMDVLTPCSLIILPVGKGIRPYGKGRRIVYTLA